MIEVEAMNNPRWLIILCLVVLVSIIAATGCVRIVQPGKSSSALVSDATLSTDIDSQSKPVNASNTFTVTTDKIYLSLKLNNAPANTQIMAKLTYIGGEDASLANSTMFNSSQTGQGNGYISFAMKSPPGGFPQGNYQVAISANGQDQISVPFTVQNLSAGKGWPTVNKFSSSQDTVPAGQSVTLSWDVSNATRITLQPEIGTIAASGTRSVTPSTTTTYKIIASNDAGSTTREISVSVGAAVSGAPDLVITDVWLEGCMIYYKIKNIGTADSPATTTYIYVDNLFPPMGGTSFVDVLKPGQEKSMVFSSYQWPWCGSDAPGASSSGGGGYTAHVMLAQNGGANHPGSSNTAAGNSSYVDWSLMNHQVKVCADAKNEAMENDKTNNCMLKSGVFWSTMTSCLWHTWRVGKTVLALSRISATNQACPALTSKWETAASKWSSRSPRVGYRDTGERFTQTQTHMSHRRLISRYPPNYTLFQQLDWPKMPRAAMASPSSSALKI